MHGSQLQAACMRTPLTHLPIVALSVLSKHLAVGPYVSPKKFSDGCRLARSQSRLVNLALNRQEIEAVTNTTKRGMSACMGVSTAATAGMHGVLR